MTQDEVIALARDIAEEAAGTPVGEQDMTDKCIWTRISEFSFRKACGGRVILFAGKPSDHKCVCGKQAVESKVCQQ